MASACASQSSFPTYKPRNDPSHNTSGGVRSPLPQSIRLMTQRSTLEMAELTVEEAIQTAQKAARQNGYSVNLHLDVAVDFDPRKREWTVVFDPAAISGEYLMVWIKDPTRKVQLVRGR